MRTFLVPIKYTLVILAIFQLYSIFKYWGNDDLKVIVSIIIFIGCLALIFVDRIFNKDTNPSK